MDWHERETTAFVHEPAWAAEKALDTFLLASTPYNPLVTPSTTTTTKIEWASRKNECGHLRPAAATSKNHRSCPFSLFCGQSQAESPSAG